PQRGNYFDTINLGEITNIGVLSTNEQKLDCVRELFPNCNIHSLVPPDYIPLLEQPFGEEEVTMCLNHRYDNIPCQNTWKYHTIVGIENGLKYTDDTITEITQFAFFNKAYGVFLTPHYTTRNIQPYIIRELKKLHLEENGQKTFGKLLEEKFNMNCKNWQPELFGIDRMDMLRQASNNPAIYTEEMGLVMAHLVLNGMSKIKIYHDFPKKGVTFKSFFPMLQNPRIHKLLIKILVAYCKHFNITDLFLVSSRGYLFASVAYKLGISVHPVFKKGKIPDDSVLCVNYEKEYGNDDLCIQKDTTISGNVGVIDDLIATGGSLNAVGKLIRQIDKDVKMYAFSILHVEELVHVAMENLKMYDRVISLS
ncbi:MAG: hypothetical protein KDI52_13150, partial [Xanthomonadales bacterium]|nr:hypothetical protein [Xanthomonadales bacterium]